MCRRHPCCWGSPTLYSWDQALFLRTLLLSLFLYLVVAVVVCWAATLCCSSWLLRSSPQCSGIKPSSCWSSPGCFQDHCSATMKRFRQLCWINVAADAVRSHSFVLLANSLRLKACWSIMLTVTSSSCWTVHELCVGQCCYLTIYIYIYTGWTFPDLPHAGRKGAVNFCCSRLQTQCLRLRRETIVALVAWNHCPSEWQLGKPSLDANPAFSLSNPKRHTWGLDLEVYHGLSACPLHVPSLASELRHQDGPPK